MSQTRACTCPYHRLRLHGWKAKEIAGHAPCCPLFDPRQYSHPFEEVDKVEPPKPFWPKAKLAYIKLFTRLFVGDKKKV